MMRWSNADAGPDLPLSRPALGIGAEPSAAACCQACCQGVVTPEIPDEHSPATPWEREASNDSRGGTRTRDPGIMSSGDSPENLALPSDDAP
jgi:hypothetical protein